VHFDVVFIHKPESRTRLELLKSGGRNGPESLLRSCELGLNVAQDPTCLGLLASALAIWHESK
jgi:hypothetical protein